MKTFIRILLGICALQATTFYFISENKLVRHIGKNYETTTFKNVENPDKNISFVSELIKSKEIIKKNFKLFDTEEFRVCEKVEKCDSLKTGYFYYFYFGFANNKNPFIINEIVEVEYAQYYAARWDSKYIWILFDWVLLDKKMTGQS